MNTPTSDIPVTLDEIADHFSGFEGNRRRRERMRIAFIDKAMRTSLRRRRWFRVSDIEPDIVARSRVIDLWRASIYSKELLCDGKSQVLCLADTPLLDDYRLPSDLARGEHFNMIVNDLWMSKRRWLEWLPQVGLTQPAWMEQSMSDKVEQKQNQGWRVKAGSRLTRSDTAILEVLNERWPNGRSDLRAGIRNHRIQQAVRERGGTVSSRTIIRALGKIEPL